MKAAAIGVSVHSGWGVVVAMSGGQGLEEVLLRRRLVIIDSKLAGSAQPYHYVKEKEINTAERHLAQYATQSGRLAFEALISLAHELRERGFMLIAAAILLSSARPLPDLDEILGSHALIHTAEGEFFRQTFRSAFMQLKIPVTGIRARDLDACALKAFGKAASPVQKRIYAMGRSVGAPWTKDEKTAALAAAIVLADPISKSRDAHNSDIIG
ncbi:MAG TPA: hypothetical protein VGQ12_08540 [Candidatus Angelobacter sp.]|jgi:hypothetical protein|nr:hypothetical protein [Candidatus Angelobacter sp.]